LKSVRGQVGTKIWYPNVTTCFC